MRIKNIFKKVKCYMKILRRHIGKTIVVHNLKWLENEISIEFVYPEVLF